MTSRSRPLQVRYTSPWHRAAVAAPPALAARSQLAPRAHTLALVRALLATHLLRLLAKHSAPGRHGRGHLRARLIRPHLNRVSPLEAALPLAAAAMLHLEVGNQT